MQKILSSILRNVKKGEIPVFHGTGVSPEEMARNIAKVSPEFSSKFFGTGTGGRVQGPGLYGTEEKGVGKHYAQLTGEPGRVFFDGRPVEERIAEMLEGVPLKHRSEYYDLVKDLKVVGQAVRDKTIDPSFFGSKNIFVRDYSTPEIKDILSKVRASDFSFPETDRYLYKVAFPRGRYMDWYGVEPEIAKDIATTAKYRYDVDVPDNFFSGQGTYNFLKGALRSKFTSASNSMGVSKKKMSYNELNNLIDKHIIDIFDKAGVQGTKYRGDAQRAGYLNYVLQHPERARIIDVFKFGLPLAAGVGMYRTGEPN